VRIIAGTARGTRLGPVPRGARPVSDRAREGLFSSLGEAVLGARVLDLFAGSGALGLEALSRGAAHATFVDRDRAATAAIRDNLERTRLAPGTVVTSDVDRFLDRIDGGAGGFDLVLLDPPYDLGSPELERVLGGVAAHALPPGGWTVALTRGNRSSNHVIPLNWAVARRLRYGDSLVFLYREV
jgi:16S rRNA (guanine966-N2)-methyltransferase